MTRSLYIVYSNLGLGGIPTKIVDIVNNLAITHPETKISILLKKRQAFSLQSTIKNKHVSVEYLPEVFFNSTFFFVFWIWFRILLYEPEGILSFISPYAIPVLATKLIFFWRRTSIIISEDHYTSTMVHSMTLPVIQIYGVRFLYPLANAIIVPTRTIKKNLINNFGISPLKIHIVSCWSKYSNTNFEILNRRYDCIYIGRLEKTKQVLQMIFLLVQIIRKSKPNLSCLLIGDGSLKATCEKYIQKYGVSKNIIIMAPTTNFASYLEQSKTFIYNPEKNTEGFPLVLLDAMACGTVVITKYFYGVEEYVNTKNGHIVNNTKELLKRIIRVLNSYPQQQTIITRARADVAAKYSLKNIKYYTKWFY